MIPIMDNKMLEPKSSINKTEAKLITQTGLFHQIISEPSKGGIGKRLKSARKRLNFKDKSKIIGFRGFKIIDSAAIAMLIIGPLKAINPFSFEVIAEYLAPSLV